jgi:hypothetical protein
MRDEHTTPTTSETLPESVVSLVAELEGVGVTDVPPLASVVDPDALATLFDGSESGGSSVVEFDYAGYRIVVRGDGDVHALEATPSTGADLCNAD